MSLWEDFRDMMAAVAATPEGRRTLQRNHQTLQVVFELGDARSFVWHLVAESPEITVTPGAVPYTRFHTIIFELTPEVLRELIDGDALFSEVYLAGEATVRGSTVVKQLVGRTFRINRELRHGPGSAVVPRDRVAAGIGAKG